MDDQQKIQEIHNAYARFQEAMSALRLQKKQIIDEIHKRLDEAKVSEMLKRLQH